MNLHRVVNASTRVSTQQSIFVCICKHGDISHQHKHASCHTQGWQIYHNIPCCDPPLASYDGRFAGESEPPEWWSKDLFLFSESPPLPPSPGPPYEPPARAQQERDVTQSVSEGVCECAYSVSAACAVCSCLRLVLCWFRCRCLWQILVVLPCIWLSQSTGVR